MKVGIVGSEAAKFTPDTEAAARSLIRALLSRQNSHLTPWATCASELDPAPGAASDPAGSTDDPAQGDVRQAAHRRPDMRQFSHPLLDLRDAAHPRPELHDTALHSAAHRPPELHQTAHRRAELHSAAHPLPELHQVDASKSASTDPAEAGQVTVVSGGCHLGGIDAWAAEEGRALGCLVLEHLPRLRAWNAPGGYKARNVLIAESSDQLHCITLKTLPAGYQGMRFKLCYHCGTSDHVKSGGCWTVKYGRKLGKPGWRHVIDPTGHVVTTAM